MPCLFRFTLRCQCFKKKRGVSGSRYGQNYFVTFFFASARTGGWPRNEGWDRCTIWDSCYHKGKGAVKTWGGGGGVGGGEHVKGKINHQLQKFTPLGLISWVTVLYFAPRAERKKRRGPMPLGLFLFFGGHLPQTSGFCSAKEILATSFATQPRAFILSDRNIFYTLGGGGGEENNGGV